MRTHLGVYVLCRVEGIPSWSFSHPSSSLEDTADYETTLLPRSSCHQQQLFSKQKQSLLPQGSNSPNPMQISAAESFIGHKKASWVGLGHRAPDTR